MNKPEKPPQNDVAGPAGRHKTTQVMVGNVAVGGGAPIVVQSMTNTDTADVEGTVAHKDELEQTVSAALAEDWTWKRVDRLVRAILLAGAYELLHRRDVPPRVAINEYVEIAHAFYDQGEPNFINSVLDRVARQARSAELVR